MQDNEKAILQINRCITALLLRRRQLSKPFRDTSKEDVRALLKWMDEKEYKSSYEKYRVILKKLYKVIYDNDDFYPEQVKLAFSAGWKGKASKGKDIPIEPRGVRYLPSTNNAANADNYGTRQSITNSMQTNSLSIISTQEAKTDNFIEVLDLLQFYPLYIHNICMSK